MTDYRLRLTAAGAALMLSACAQMPGGSAGSAPGSASALEAPRLEPYVATVEVIPATGASPRDRISGVVFEDLDRDGRRDSGEPGIEGVSVSNGEEVVATGPDGGYSLPARADMNLFVTKPAGYRTPTDENWVPQFAYIHKEEGTPADLRYGGLPATGPVPAAVNFPLIESPEAEEFACAVVGDSQTYSNNEVGYLRDSLVNDILDRRADGRAEPLSCMIWVGDVMGDDLGLLPRLLDIAGLTGVPQYLVHGNHDFDFDAPSDAHSADSWRRLYGPEYYSATMGDVHLVVLDNVVYPCTEAEGEGREFCTEGDRPTYNGRVTERQMRWLEADLARVPEDKLIVLAHHIPFVSFVDSTSPKHQTDNLAEIHALIGDRPALSISGHTHTIENLRPGTEYAGWREAVGVGPLPFPHIIAGAASGAWYQGDFSIDGVPMSLQRLGAPSGYLELSFDGADFTDRYYGTNIDPEREMWLSFSTPDFREWFETVMAWRAEDWRERDPVPPLNVNDLPDTSILTPEELAGGSYLVANVWNGTDGTEVSVRINGGEAMPLTRTQEGRGEAPRIGAEWADPFAAERQLTVARWAYESRSGDEDAQGYRAFQGRKLGPAPPQPQFSVADRSESLWRLRLPEDLPEGAHVAEVTVVFRDGRRTGDRIPFEVRAERPDPYWRDELWD